MQQPPPVPLPPVPDQAALPDPDKVEGPAELTKRFRHYEPAVDEPQVGLKRRLVGTGLDLGDSTRTDTDPIPNAEEVEQREVLHAFMAERIEIDSRLNKNQKKQAAGKNLNYQKCDDTTRAGLDGSRKTEWKKWKQFEAGTIIRGDSLHELIQQGH